MMIKRDVYASLFLMYNRRNVSDRFTGEVNENN